MLLLRVCTCFRFLLPPLLAVALLGVASQAAPPSGALRVIVLDDHRAPLAGIPVFVRPSGGSDRVEETNERGIADFPGMQPGFYEVRVVAPAFDPLLATVEFAYEDRDRTLEVTLVPHLKTIANVHSRVSAQWRDLRTDKGLGRLSVTLVDLLNTLGGADVRTGPDGSLIGVSLRGQDPSLTSTSFNGIALEGSVALGALDPDLLQSASVSDARDAVDFRSLGPAPYPIDDTRARVNGFSGREGIATVQGTSGHIGYAASGLLHDQGTVLNSSSFLDTSGLIYPHNGGYENHSVDVKIVPTFSDTFSGKIEYLGRTSERALLSTYRAGDIPEGYGPNNTTNYASGIATAELDASVGKWALRGTLLDLKSFDADDFRNRYSARLPTPSLFYDRSHITATSFSAGRALPRGGVLNLNFGWTATRTRADEPLGAAVGSLSTSEARLLQQYLSVNVNTSHHGWSYSLDSDYAQTQLPTVQMALRESLDVTWDKNSAIQWFGSFRAGTRIGPSEDVRPFDPPAAAQYDCNGRNIIAEAPNEGPAVPSEASASIGVTRNGSLGSVSAQAYYHGYRGMLLTQALVAAQALPVTTLPPDYLALLAAGFSTYGGCSAGPPPTVYLQQDVVGVGVDYSGLEIVASRRFGSRLSTQASFGLHQAILRATNAPLASSLSPYIIGRQIPFVAPIQASASADYVVDPRTEILANVVLRSSNNDNALPGYALVSVGAVRALSPAASLTFIATNVSDQFVDIFSSPRYAVPLQTASGTPLLTVAAPLRQPDLYVLLRFHIERPPM